MNKICLIIPVYNEEKNIQKLFMKIKKLKIKFDILYIEDNSTDNTRAEILKLVKKKIILNIYLEKEKKELGQHIKTLLNGVIKKSTKKF